MSDKIHKLFISELTELLQKYDAKLMAEDHYPGYAECGEDIRITVEFNDFQIPDLDLGQWFDGRRV